MANENNQNKESPIVLTKEQFETLQAAAEALPGLKGLVDAQNKQLQEQSAKLTEMEKTVAETASRAANAVSAIHGTYVRPATIATGEYPYLTFGVRVLYKQANATGVVAEKEQEFKITMPKPCGHLNSIESELNGRIIPRMMAEKGIVNYMLVSVTYDDENIEKKSQKPSFIGKKPNALSIAECEEFAIIYEGLRIPTNGSLATARSKVAEEWGYIIADVEPNKPWIVNGAAVNKANQKLDLVSYDGVRQKYPQLDSVSPARFREIADSEPESDDK